MAEPGLFPAKDKKKHTPGDGALVKGRNEPCQIRSVLDVLAGLHGISSENLAATIYETTARVFFPPRQA